LAWLNNQTANDITGATANIGYAQPYYWNNHWGQYSMNLAGGPHTFVGNTFGDVGSGHFSVTPTPNVSFIGNTFPDYAPNPFWIASLSLPANTRAANNTLAGTNNVYMRDLTPGSAYATAPATSGPVTLDLSTSKDWRLACNGACNLAYFKNGTTGDTARVWIDNPYTTITNGSGASSIQTGCGQDVVVSQPGEYVFDVIDGPFQRALMRNAECPAACPSGQYATATTTSGLNCAQVAYSQLSGAPGALSVSLAGLGGFYFPTIQIPDGANTNTASLDATNQVRASQFVLPFTVTVGHLAFNIDQAYSGGTCAVGIYDSTGAKLIDSGVVSTTNSGTQYIALPSSVTLPAGVYYGAWGGDNTTFQLGALVTGQWWTGANGRFASRNGIAANYFSSTTSLPSALGTLGSSYLTGYNLPIIWFEP
jgi:hypothetical protein